MPAPGIAVRQNEVIDFTKKLSERRRRRKGCTKVKFRKKKKKKKARSAMVTDGPE